MSEGYANDFAALEELAMQLKKPLRVAIAGAEVENILLGAFDAQEKGFVKPILIGNYGKIKEMLDRLGLADRKYDLQPVNGSFEVPDRPGIGNELSEVAFQNCDLVTVQ